MNKYDYTNKIVYVGIDVHKKTYSCVCICDKEVVKRDTMPAGQNIRLLMQYQLKQLTKQDFQVSTCIVI